MAENHPLDPDLSPGYVLIQQKPLGVVAHSAANAVKVL
ncbi:hypothetical protein ABH925_005238 [Streptacidiphilus sp. EB129]